MTRSIPKPALDKPFAARLVAAALLALAAAPAAEAAEAEAEMAELTVNGVRHGYDQEAIVTATKTATALIDTPQAVSVITRALIDDQAMQGIQDAVRYMPGVGMAQGEGNRNTPIMRGVSSTANFFVDGVRDDVEYFRDLYNVERVEGLSGPNAMIFGRGGGGGVINRVTRQADGHRGGELTLQTGSWNQRRATLDLSQPLSDRVSARITALYEASDSYRDGVVAERSGLNPTVRAKLSERTSLDLAYEHFAYDMVADRGVPSFQGRPVRTGSATFFGSPAQSPTEMAVDRVNAVIVHDFAAARLRSVTSYGDYDKFYQNVYPGAVNGGGTLVALSAYNNDTQRQNLFHQTDLTWTLATGPVTHVLLTGFELGRQTTDNLRQTGYFTAISPTATSQVVSLASPTGLLPLSFRPSATDAANHSVADSAGLYVQDQITLTDKLQAILGLRHDQFEMNFRNNRTGVEIRTQDRLWSPRAGLVYKPVDTLAVYASYSLSYLPRAGDQLASLTAANAALEPESFRNREVGVKWDLRPTLSVTAALYQLDRTNVAVADPADPARLVLVDGQRSKGLELGIHGLVRPGWTIAGGYAWQEGEISSTQSATAKAGARLAQLPKQSASLWNRVDLSPHWAVGLGLIHRSAIFTSTDNSVTLPGYSRIDGAVFYRLNDQAKIQLNVENLFDVRYFASAHNNNNITPGAPRAAKLSLTLQY
jgi:catecholate siderophore receptor